MIQCIIHDNKYRKEIIKRPENIIELIDELLFENDKRLKNDYYNYELLKIKSAYEINLNNNEKNNATISIYKSKLHKELIEIFNCLQNMEIRELSNHVTFSPPEKFSYQFSKLSDAFWSQNTYSTHHILTDEFKNYLSDYIDYDYIDNVIEEYVLTCAGLYCKELEK